MSDHSQRIKELNRALAEIKAENARLRDSVRALIQVLNSVRQPNRAAIIAEAEAAIAFTHD